MKRISTAWSERYISQLFVCFVYRKRRVKFQLSFNAQCKIYLLVYCSDFLLKGIDKWNSTFIACRVYILLVPNRYVKLSNRTYNITLSHKYIVKNNYFKHCTLNYNCPAQHVLNKNNLHRGISIYGVWSYIHMHIYICTWYDYQKYLSHDEYTEWLNITTYFICKCCMEYNKRDHCGSILPI